MDDEVAACAAIVDALSPLDPEARNRVLYWAGDRYRNDRLTSAMETMADLLHDAHEALLAAKKDGSPEIRSFAETVLRDPRMARLAVIGDDR